MEYELACQLGRLPEEEEIAKALRISSQELIALRQIELGATTVSLEAVKEGGQEKSRIVAQEACTDGGLIEEQKNRVKKHIASCGRCLHDVIDLYNPPQENEVKVSEPTTATAMVKMDRPETPAIDGATL